MKKFIIFTATIFLLYNFQCNDCETELNGNISYTAEIQAAQTIYNVGDEINIKTEFPSTFQLDVSGEEYDNSNSFMNFPIQLLELTESNGDVKEAMSSFDITSIEGDIETTDFHSKRSARRIETNCSDSVCGFELVIKPKKAGIYCIGLMQGNFGREACDFLRVDNNKFDVDSNNFELAEKINTTEFKPLESSFVQNPELAEAYYFIEVQ